MLGGSRLFQGLTFGIIGCVMVPLTKSSFFTGGGINPSNANETVSSLAQVTAQESPSLTTPKRETFVKLLLAGTKAEEGLVAELSREDKADSQWKVGKVTWQGKEWNRNWTLYSDNADGEYTFTDKTWYERNTGCWGLARYWGRNKVCVAYGKVKKEEETRWKNNFPKIRFDGWTTGLRGGGFSTSITPSVLSNCTLSIKENKSKDNDTVTVTISCQSGWLNKKLSGSDFERIAFEKH